MKTGIDTREQAPSREHWNKVALAIVALGILAGVVALTAGPGYRLGWWGLSVGIKAISWSGKTAAAILVLAPFGALVAYKKQLGPVAAKFLAAALISAFTAVPVAYFGYKASTLPHIHDVSTDLADPPPFIAVLPLRKEAKNPAQYDPKIAPLQKDGYPDIAPIPLDRPSPKTFALVQQIAQSMGWDVVAVDANALRIEATATTLLFGFKDDIVIRVTPNGAGSIVDMRSLSRIGGSDIGANAGRIRDFRKRLTVSSVTNGNT